jgi:hypothetical protein
VCPGRALADGELGGDLLVGLARRHETEHVQLAGCELGDRVVVSGVVKGRHQPSRDDRIDLQLASVRGPDGGCHVVGIGVLEHIARCPCLERGVHTFLLGERRERHHFDVVVESANLAGRLDPVDRRHLQIHDDHVGPAPLRLQRGEHVKRLGAPFCRAYDVDIGLAVEERKQPAAHDLVVVDNQDTDGFMPPRLHLRCYPFPPGR